MHEVHICVDFGCKLCLGTSSCIHAPRAGCQEGEELVQSEQWPAAPAAGSIQDADIVSVMFLTVIFGYRRRCAEGSVVACFASVVFTMEHAHGLSTFCHYVELRGISAMFFGLSISSLKHTFVLQLLYPLNFSRYSSATKLQLHAFICRRIWCRAQHAFSCALCATVSFRI